MIPEAQRAIIGLQWLALLAQVRHNARVAETTAARVGSRKCKRRTHRHLAGFFRPYADVRLLWAGDGGEGASPAGSLLRRSSNPAICPPTPFGSGERGQPQKEAAMATTSHVRASQYPLVEEEARHAAELWLQHAPEPLADWCDTRFQCLAAGMGWYSDYHDRKAAFEQAYALRIGQAIAGVRHV